MSTTSKKTPVQPCGSAGDFSRMMHAEWLDSDDAVVVANAMLIIIGRALKMLKSQIEAQSRQKNCDVVDLIDRIDDEEPLQHSSVSNVKKPL